MFRGDRSALLKDRISRSKGALLGLAVGDAIGTTVEFKPRGSFPLMTDMVGGGIFKLPVGAFTDDTSVALCLGTSILDNGFDLKNQIKRYTLWYEFGYFSSTGKCFDIGTATLEAIERYQETGNPRSGSTGEMTAGNGCITRLAPVVIRYLHDPHLALVLSVEQSLTTHAAPECLFSCQIFGEILIRALQGKTKHEILSALMPDLHLTTRLRGIADGKYKSKEVTEISSSGYVVASLEAALYCFWKTSSFEECVLKAVNLGEDADSVGALCGQLAGAFYGHDAIPSGWIKKLVMGPEISQLAEDLAQASWDDC